MSTTEAPDRQSSMRRQPMPTVVKPMKAVLTGSLPSDDDRRANEVKLPHHRVRRSVTRPAADRHLLDATGDFPELESLGRGLGWPQGGLGRGGRCA